MGSRTNARDHRLRNLVSIFRAERSRHVGGPTGDEIRVNAVLAGVLRKKHPAWKVSAEERGVFERAKARKPDPVGSPTGPGLTVIVETEFEPAR